MFVLPDLTFLPNLTFLPDATTLLLFSGACFVLFVTPGPDMSLFLAKTISGGRRAGLAAMAGAMTGCCVHTLLAAIGLSALLAASTTAFTILKIVGAFYLLWMAYDAIRNGSALSVKTDAPHRAPFWRTYLIGIGINLTNPKIVLFFVTFLPQFVAAGDPHASEKLVFLGLYFIAFSAPLAALLVLGAERVISLLKGNPKVLRGIDYAFGGLFATFALKILATGGR